MEEAEGKMKGFAEKMSEKFESLETQKKSLRKSIFSVFFEWKGFEEQIVSTQNCFKQGLSELESKEKELYSVQDSLSQVVKELDSERESLKKKVQDVEEKEKEFKMFSDRGVMKLNKERDDFLKEVEFREGNLQEREKGLEDLLKKLESQKGEISMSTQAMERKRVEIEGKEANIVKLNKEREEFSKEIELREANLQEREKSLEDFLKQLEIHKEEIEGIEEKVVEREKKVVANEKELELLIERQREVELKAKDLDLMIEDLVFKEKDVELIRDLNEKSSKELATWEKQLGAKEKDIELIRDLNENCSKEMATWEKLLGAKEKDIELIRDLNENRSKELATWEKQLGAKEKDVELIRDLIANRSKELDMRGKQLGVKDKKLEMLVQKAEEQCDNVLEKNGVIGMKKIEEYTRGLETEPKEKEVQLNRKSKVKPSKEPPLQKCKELDVSKKKTVDDRIKVAESDHKHSNEEDNLDSSQPKQKKCHLGKNLQRQQLNDGHHASVEEGEIEESLGRQSHEENHDCNQLAMKEIHLDGHCLKERQQPQKNQLNNEHHASVKEAAAEEPKERKLYKENCSENHLKKKGNHLEKKLSVKEDTVKELKEKTPSLVGKGIREEGYDLHKFLQDHGKELDTVVDQVIKTIQQSKEPAKLVLTAIEEFYNRVITEKEMEEKKEIAFRSCILLLDQLMKLSVDSHLSSVKDEALKFARVWKSNITIRDSFEVLGFLYLVASYKLTNAFPIDALIRCLEVVAQHQQTPDLCRRLDLKNNIHVLITELIRKNQILLAFEYVHELELLDTFPPVALLKRHVLSSSMEARKMVSNKKKKNHEAQDRALFFEISALKDVIRCIMHRSLQADYPPNELKERIELLERQRESLKASSVENQKENSYRSSNTQHDNTMRRPSKKKQKKRRRSDNVGRYNNSELPPPSKWPRHVTSPEVYHSEGHRSGNPPFRHPDDTTFHTDPYSPRWQQQHNQSDPPCHVNDLVSKYLTAGNRESVYPGPFQYEEQPPLQSMIMKPEQSFYPAHPWTYDDRW